jgi:hypothetical protein
LHRKVTRDLLQLTLQRLPLLFGEDRQRGCGHGRKDGCETTGYGGHSRLRVKINIIVQYSSLSLLFPLSLSLSHLQRSSGGHCGCKQTEVMTRYKRKNCTYLFPVFSCNDAICSMRANELTCRQSGCNDGSGSDTEAEAHKHSSGCSDTTVAFRYNHCTYADQNPQAVISRPQQTVALPFPLLWRLSAARTRRHAWWHFHTPTTND